GYRPGPGSFPQTVRRGERGQNAGQAGLRAASVGRGRKRRQLADVARVVLNDHHGFEVARDLLEPIERGQSLRPARIPVWYLVGLVALAQMTQVAAEQHVA